MDDIKVPYIPISSFDESVVSECFPEPLPKDDTKLNEFLMPSLSSADGQEISDKILIILIGMGMEKYIDVFKKEHVLLDTFLQLNDSDLQELGITDPKDREIICKNLSVHQKTKNARIVPENPDHDLRILKNISHHIMLLQNYCAYVELQMRKHTFTDYRINTDETACTYLRAFTEAALVQSKTLCTKIYDEQNNDSLIVKILKENNLVLPKHLKKALPKKKKTVVFKALVVIGFTSAAILIGSHFIKKFKLCKI